MNCPNANDEQCRYPECGCHEPREPHEVPDARLANVQFWCALVFCLCVLGLIAAAVFGSPVSGVPR